jgi:type VI secretion system FHA domain protein
MTLRLSVVSEHGIRLGAHSTKVFGVHGGSIGRGTDNAWILPDPERYLSGKHARIDFRAGSYVLVDTSSNGTYVNGAQVPLGKYHDYTLKDGDYVRLGEYELLVSIDKGNDFPPERGAIVAYDGKSPSSAATKSTANDIGADLDLSQLLEPSDQLEVGTGVRPRNSYGQSVTPDWAAPPVEEEPSATPWHMMTRPLKMEAKPGPAGIAGTPAYAAARASVAASAQAARAPQTPVLFDGDFEIGLSAFCRGAGIDPRTITPEARGAVLQVAGQLLRESMLGLMDLTQGRNEFRNRFRLSVPASDAPESPLNFSGGVDEALVRLLTNPSARAPSVDAIRENFKELKAQHTAWLAAMRSAFEAFLERVDPKELEERFDRAAKRSVFGTHNKGKYWDLYAEMFAGLAQRPADGFPHLFTEAFAKEYEAKLRTLIPPRRSTFGADRNEPIEPDGKAVGDL